MIENLVIEYFTLRVTKMSHIKGKRYSEAAETRDKERVLLKKIFCLLNDVAESNESTFDMDKSLSKYCLETYGCGSESPKKILTIIDREQKLKSIGLK